ncbi:MAG: TonB family protein [Gammaproteobacteria bacterium]|nr:TonB family protein [Gammaproteobacteria bacterium]
MDTSTKPIIATTTLSFLVHSVVVAGMLLAYGQTATQDEGVGRGVEIQLVSSVQVSDQQAADQPVPDMSVSPQVVAEVSSESLMHSAQKPFAEKILTSLNNTQAIAVTEPEKNVRTDIKQEAAQQQDVQPQVDEGESVASIAQATNASHQQHAIVELLHQRISDNKEYPYLARKQRREGVATVAFVLHPDGSIEDAHLVSSSRAQVLDRAALSAVKKIAPFEGARQYLQQSETFQVAVEFDLL